MMFAISTLFFLAQALQPEVSPSEPFDPYDPIDTGSGLSYQCDVYPLFYDGNESPDLYLGCMIDCPGAKRREVRKDLSLDECRAGVEVFENGTFRFLCRYYVPHEKPGIAERLCRLIGW